MRVKVRYLRVAGALGLAALVAACGGGGGGGGTTGGGGSTTTVSGTVTLPGAVAGGVAVVGAGGFRPMAGAALTNATVEMYDADRPDWLYPVAVALTNESGGYSLGTLTNSSLNGGSYANGDPVPAGNYTIIAFKVDVNAAGGFYVAVQPYVKNFSGAVTGNDLVAQDNALVPSVTSMFGIVAKNADGTYGGGTVPLPRNAAIQVTFNMAMARLTVLNAVSITDALGDTVAGTWKVAPDLLSATFYPASNLTVGDVYTVTVGASAKNVYGKPIPGEVTGSFQAAAVDDLPPNAQLNNPSPLTNVPVTTKIRIRASEALDLNTFAVTSTPSIGDRPTVLFDGIGNDSTYPFLYQIVPNGNLAAGTNYAVTVSGAKDLAGNALTAATYNFATASGADGTAPVTFAAPPGGTYADARTVSLLTNEAADVYYTTDGSTPAFPVAGSTQTYLAPITVSSNTTLKFFARDAAGNAETPKTETYVITTTDTTAPTTAVSPPGGSYASALTVTLTANEPATIYHTTDGSAPTTASPVYTAPISIAATTTLRYFARDTAGNAESPRTDVYTISALDTTAPTTLASPLGGTYGSAQSVTLTASEAATIYYTTDGSAPTTFSPIYTGAISIASTTTLRYFAVDTAGNAESPQSQVYTITVADTTPPVTTASPSSGTFTSDQVFTLSSNEAATIYYTTDGSTPTTASNVYTGALLLTGCAHPCTRSYTIRYFARDTAGNSETPKTAGYTIAYPDVTAPVTTASPAGGAYSATQTVTLTAADSSTTTIYYTLDGSTPTTSSAIYSGPISVLDCGAGTSCTKTLKFFARDAAGNQEAVKTETYVFNTPLPGGIWDTHNWDAALWQP